jgi:hypothetical protein
MEKNPSRRQAVKQVSVVVAGIATMLVLPSRWTKPVIESIVGPALGETLTQLASQGFSRFGSVNQSTALSIQASEILKLGQTSDR